MKTSGSDLCSRCARHGAVLPLPLVQQDLQEYGPDTFWPVASGADSAGLHQQTARNFNISVKLYKLSAGIMIWGNKMSVRTVDMISPCGISEVGQDGSEGLRGALRFPPCPHHIRRPRSSVVVPHVRDVVCRWEHERRGFDRPLLTSLLPLLPASHGRIHGQVAYGCVQKHDYMHRNSMIILYAMYSYSFALFILTGLSFTGMYEQEKLNNAGEHKVRDNSVKYDHLFLYLSYFYSMWHSFYLFFLIFVCRNQTAAGTVDTPARGGVRATRATKWTG